MAITVRTNPGRLGWSLFREVSSMPNGGSEDAQINPEMSPIANVHPQRTPKGTFRLPSLTLTVGINRQNTVVLRTAKKTSELLQHEQGHFDLLTLTCRALARDLEAIEAQSVQDLGTHLEDAKTRHEERAQAIDAEYDRQTDHSRNRAAQLKWDAAIAHALRDPRATKLAGMPL